MAVTDEREMRAQAREIAERLSGFRMISPTASRPQTVYEMADIIAKALAAERDAERERCRKDVCSYCRHGNIPERKEGGGFFIWAHTRGSDCLAYAIRERVRSRVAAKEKK